MLFCFRLNLRPKSLWLRSKGPEDRKMEAERGIQREGGQERAGERDERPSKTASPRGWADFASLKPDES